MNFQIDHQTIKDLDLFCTDKGGASILDFFNLTATKGGKERLYKIMKTPSNDIRGLIVQRDSIRFFMENPFELRLKESQLDFIEHYLKQNIAILPDNPAIALIQNISYRLMPENDYYLIKKGIEQIQLLIKNLTDSFEKIPRIGIPVGLHAHFNFVTELLQGLNSFNLNDGKKGESCFRINKFDNLFRKDLKDGLLNLIDILYQMDALQSVAHTAMVHNLVLPEYLEQNQPKVSIISLSHPLIKNAVPNDLEMDEHQNLFFLTGPNMAGKSTFLKSLGVSLYLAHLGFPVSAKKFETTIFNGLVTTINLTDNLHLGHSHFFGEVMRVKETALLIKEKRKLFVIFDELFRGTNVKDAYDASLMILTSFSKIKDCSFCISTHIVEIADEIKDDHNILFRFFDIKLSDETPVYSYKLREGVSKERTGLMLLKNERILEILESINYN